MKVATLKSTSKFLQSFFLLAGAMLCATASKAQTTPTVIQISNSVVQSGTHRLGINLGDQGYWDSGQMMKNLVFTNPGFEGLKYRVILHCSSVTATTCMDDNEYNGQSNGYWTGGSYRVITGAANGATGSVLNNTLSATPCRGCGPTIQFDQNVNMGVGDYVELSKFFPGNGDAGWWEDKKGGATITSETNDLSPNTPGQQAIVLGASGAGQSAALNQYFDSYANLSFIQLNGSFEVTFRAKAIDGNNQLHVNVGRAQAGLAPYLGTVLTLTNTWQDYTLTFNANETGSAVGTVALSFTATGASVELDDVSLNQTNSSPSNPTVFRDDVVNALKQLNPGTIRMMAAGAALGSDIPNQLQVPFARHRGGFNADATSEQNIAYGIHEFLQLCQTVGSDPWITIPTATTPEEMTDFIQYLTGNGSDTFSALRISRGQTAPWTSVFTKIHIELGNETWNGDFKGESMTIPGYPQWANQVFGAARQAPGYQANSFDLILDGWSQVAWYDTELLSYSTQHDAIDIAPYLMYSLNNEPQAQMFGAMMAEPEMFESTGGIINTIVTGAQTAPTPTKVNVYETNLGTMIGNPTQAQLDALAPSVAAGVTTANHMLQMMRLGVQYQNAFSLPQFGFRRGDGKSVKLWGYVVDMGTTNRRRPQYYTQAMANAVIGGNMLQTVQAGTNPTWNQPLSSDNVQLSNAHYLQSFAFLNGNQASTIVFNLSLTDAMPVTFSGVNAPTGTVEMTQLTSANMTDNNETASVVAPTTQTLNGFNPAAVLSLPPFSMTVLSWTSTQAQSPQFSVAAGTYSTTQTVSLINTTAGANSYYTTDGTYPTIKSAQYTGPITVSASTKIEAITLAPGFTNSPVAVANYTIQPFAVVPTIMTPAGIYSTTQTVAIASTTPGASIFYTMDGSAPTTASRLYAGPVQISANATLNAIAAAQNYSNSPVASAVYTIAPPTPAPYFTTPAGSFTTAQVVAILDQVGGSIYYTTDGSTPTPKSHLYSSPLTVSSSETLEAIAIAPGFSSSAVTSATYTISTLAATPIFSIAGATYNVPQTLTFSDVTAGAIIHYTLDGSAPTVNSPVFTNPITIDSTEYISAAAIAPGYKMSYVANGMFTMAAAAPQTNLAAGIYTGTQTITLSTITPRAAIFYTLDGSTPTTQSAVYAGPITIKASATINAMAGRMGYSNSAVVSSAYVITSGSALPVFSPAAGTYPTTQLVTITDATPNSTIYYTLDGTTPTTQSTIYAGAITVGANQTLNAQAFVNGAQGSPIATAAYVISHASMVPFANGFTTNQLHTNGSAQVIGNNLQLVSGHAAQGGTAWYTSKVSVDSFTTDFDFQLPSSTSNGFTFTLQNSNAETTALGGNSSGMGYWNIKNSVAVAFNLYQSGVAGAESIGVYTGGTSPQGGNAVNLVGTGINLHNGDTFHVQIIYCEGTMTVVLTDKQTGAAVTENFAVDVAGTIGSGSAYVGLTGSTGARTSVQNILNWTYSN